MAEVQWYHIVAPLLGGGAAGAVINSIVAAVRNRIQPVGRRVESLPVFKQTLGKSSLRSMITIHEGTTEHHFHNLFLIDIQIVNRGNRDVEKFPFGITLKPGDKAVYIEHEAPDRHHQVTKITAVTPGNPADELDFELVPFNRGDSYSLKLYVVIPEGREEPGKVQLSSSQPVRFTDMPTIGELVSQAAKSTILDVGFMKLTIGGR